jgi:hypothetical protein
MNSNRLLAAMFYFIVFLFSALLVGVFFAVSSIPCSSSTGYEHRLTVVNGEIQCQYRTVGEWS